MIPDHLCSFVTELRFGTLGRSGRCRIGGGVDGSITSASEADSYGIRVDSLDWELADEYPGFGAVEVDLAAG